MHIDRRANCFFCQISRLDKPHANCQQNQRRAGSCWLRYHLELKGHGFEIIFRKPGFRGVGIREGFEVIEVPTSLLALTEISGSIWWTVERPRPTGQRGERGRLLPGPWDGGPRSSR